MRKREGYLLIDHRAVHAPPMPGQVNGGGIFESATITCSHCNRVVVLNPDRSRPRGYCRKCDHYVCDNPECNKECLPMSKVLDDLQEAAARGHDLIAQLRKDII